MRVAKLLWTANIPAEYSHQDSPKFKKQLDDTLERGIEFFLVPFLFIFCSKNKHNVYTYSVHICIYMYTYIYVNIQYIGIPFMVVFGEDELKKDIIKLKNMREHTEEELSMEKLVERLLAQGCVVIPAGTDLGFLSTLRGSYI
jgi:histidyl-tRNA synthetase